jgi:hypothetical protein
MYVGHHEIAQGQQVEQPSHLEEFFRTHRPHDRRLGTLHDCDPGSWHGNEQSDSESEATFPACNVEGAKLFGYRGDTAHETSALINKEPALHADYRQAVSSTVGRVSLTTSVIHEGGVDRTNVGVFVTILTTIGGLDNSKKQKIARNPLPSWLFCVEKDVAKSCQRSLWEAEGSPTRDALKLGQSVDCPKLQTTRWPSDKRKTKISFLPESIRKPTLENLPLLLVSAALLLYRFGIVS